MRRLRSGVCEAVGLRALNFHGLEVAARRLNWLLNNNPTALFREVISGDFSMMYTKQIVEIVGQ